MSADAVERFLKLDDRLAALRRTLCTVPFDALHLVEHECQLAVLPIEELERLVATIVGKTGSVP